MNKNMVLLWTNASPGSAFAEQTVPLDLSGYDFVAVITRFGANDDNAHKGHSITFLKIGWPMSKMVCYRGDSVTIFGQRNAMATSSGVQFEIGYENTTASTTRVIPQEIYGIKA